MNALIIAYNNLKTTSVCYIQSCSKPVVSVQIVIIMVRYSAHFSVKCVFASGDTLTVHICRSYNYTLHIMQLLICAVLYLYYRLTN